MPPKIFCCAVNHYINAVFKWTLHAWCSESTVDSSENVMFFSYFRKPFQIDELIARILQLVQVSA